MGWGCWKCKHPGRRIMAVPTPGPSLKLLPALRGPLCTCLSPGWDKTSLEKLRARSGAEPRSGSGPGEHPNVSMTNRAGTGFVPALRKHSLMEREARDWKGLPRQWWNPILGSVQKPVGVALGDMASGEWRVDGWTRWSPGVFPTFVIPGFHGSVSFPHGGARLCPSFPNPFRLGGIKAGDS